MTMPAIAIEPEVPELAERPKRRQYTAEYKKRVLEEYEALPKGEQGALLRREGLYSSHIDAWRKQRDTALAEGLMPKQRGRKPKPKNPMAHENAVLRRRLARTERALKQAQAIIEIQKKVSETLGIPLASIESDENE